MRQRTKKREKRETGKSRETKKPEVTRKESEGEGEAASGGREVILTFPQSFLVFLGLKTPPLRLSPVSPLLLLPVLFHHLSLSIPKCRVFTSLIVI